MLSKLRLDQTKKFEVAIAANLVSVMLTSFISGRTHVLGIGSEQGGILKWDDFVIETSTDVYEHIQAKRQQTPFSKDNSIRDTYSRGPRKGKLKDLSPLDESMSSLANWIISYKSQQLTTKRRFSLIVPSLTIDIKKDLQLLALHTLCETQINSSTTIAGLQALEGADPIVKKLFDWLRTWCGFSDYQHMLDALSVFEIKQYGNENDIKANTLQILSNCFSNDHLVLSKITQYIEDNTSFTSAIKPRALLMHLIEDLLPSTNSWTQYRRDGNGWEVSGIHDRSNSTIECASLVVPALWASGGGGHLKYYSQSHDSIEDLPKAIVRFVLHFQSTAVAHINDINAWNVFVRGLVGNTLGISETDCDNISAIDNNDNYTSSDVRTLSRIAEHELEAGSLSNEMHKKTWLLICDAVYDKILKMNPSELRSAIDDRWVLWKNKLDAEVEQQKTLCKLMFHPSAEGDDILAELRIGPKTASLVANGIYLLLIVAVSLNNMDSGWENIDDYLTVSVKALSHWSGPAGKPRQVRKITDDGISSLLGRETSKILVFSKVDAASSEILDESLAEDREFAGSIASSKQPVLLITNSPKLNRLIRNGVVSEITDFLKGELDKGMSSRMLNIEI